MPAFLAAVPLLGKIGLGAAGKAAAGKVAAGAAKAAATGAAKKGMLAGTKRMAGDVMTKYLGGKPTVGALADRFGFDAFFGGMSALNTPGDLGDKLIAGTATAAGGALGGIGAFGAVNKLTGKVPTDRLRGYLEMGGSLVGDQVGYGVADNLMRVKGGGTTPYEKMMMEQDAQYRAQVEAEMRAKLGLPNTDLGVDPFLFDNGLS